MRKENTEKIVRTENDKQKRKHRNKGKCAQNKQWTERRVKTDVKAVIKRKVIPQIFLKFFF